MTNPSGCWLESQFVVSGKRSRDAVASLTTVRREPDMRMVANYVKDGPEEILFEPALAFAVIDVPGNRADAVKVEDDVRQ